MHAAPVKTTTAVPPDGGSRTLNGWLCAVSIIAACVAAVLASILWQTPYPLSEGVALLEDVADASSFGFLLPLRTYYRPLYHLSLYTAWHASRSPEAFVATARLMQIAPVAILLVLFIVRLRPRTVVDAAAATLGVAVLVGSAAFLDNLEIPLTYTTVGMPLLLAAWMLTERTARPAGAWLFVALAVLAVGFKEQGLVLLPVIIAAWWTKAPGVSRTTAAWMVGIGVAYVGLRLSQSARWAPFEQDIGFGFQVLPAAEAAARFGRFPLGVYAYNAASTIANVLFAEPTAGVFSITGAMLHGSALPWQYIYLLSSGCLTGLLAWWGVRCVRRARAAGWDAESRTVVILAVALAASGALSFNYSRDRLGGMALVPYAVAAFYAVRAALVALSRAGVLRAVTVGAALLLLAASWQTRVLHTLDGARKRAADNHREWITALYQRRAEFAGRPYFERLLDELSPQGSQRPAVTPLRYPAWVRDLLGPS